jgi:8-hydroxy-5-deazaflavin:NADPH oxidoreductase
MVMKVGVLGSGTVGQTLAAGFLKHGHEVMVGTREPSKLADWNRANPKARVGSSSDAAVFAEVLVLAVKGGAAAEVLRSAGKVNIQDKPVIDTCNPIADAPPIHGVLQFSTGPNQSLMEQLQKEFPDAHLVKAFNSVGAAGMVNPHYAGTRPTMFICGNDEGAKKTVTAILDQFGWETADMGLVEAARAIEPLCMLWCILGFNHNEWSHAFKLLRQ